MPAGHSPETNQYRCEACGRHFNTEPEIAEHQKTCVAALQSGQSGKSPIQHPREEGDDREWVSVP